MKNSVVRRILLVVLAGLVLLPFGIALAQQVTTTTQADGTRVTVGNIRIANLTGPEMLREAQRFVERMLTSRRTIATTLDRARQERDIIRVNCVSDRLTQTDVSIRSAREHQELLSNAVSLSNMGQSRHEYALIVVYRDRTLSAEAEARQCLGEEAGSFGEGTTVFVRVNPNIAPDQDNLYPIQVIIIERPALLSPVN